RDDDELFARARPISHWIRRVLVRNVSAPYFLPGLLVEGVQIAVAAADKDHAALRHQRAAFVIWRTEAFRQRDTFQQRAFPDVAAAFSNWHLPRNLAFVQIDRGENGPRWRDEWQTSR